MARVPLFKRLPKNTQRLDAAQGNVLERYLGVVDSGFDRVLENARALLDLRDPDLIPDRYLPLMGPLVGHRWRSDRSREWNRRRIRDAIRRHSYKGTRERLGDLIREHGGGDWDVLDMASTLMVWNRQGRWSRGDSFFLASDFYHPGAFLLRITDQVNFPEFRDDFEEIRAAGEVWYFEIAICAGPAACETICTPAWDVDEDAVPPKRNRWNLDLFLNQEPVPGAEIVVERVPVWDCVSAPGSLWNRDLFLNMEPQIGCELVLDALPAWECGPTVAGRWNVDLDLNCKPSPTVAIWLDSVIMIGAITGGMVDVRSLIRIARDDIRVDQGTADNPLSIDAAGMQEPAEMILEEL